MTDRDDALALLEAQLLEAQQMLERECAERHNLEARVAEMAAQITALQQRLAEAGIAPD